MGRRLERVINFKGDERRYLQSLDDISTFIASYLTAMGARPAKKTTVTKWLRRLKRRFLR